MTCEHHAFKTIARIGRLLAKEGDTAAVAFTAELRITCVDCGEPFQFIGLPAGSSPVAPSVSVDGEEARMPIAPASGHASPLDVMAAATSPRH